MASLGQPLEVVDVPEGPLTAPLVRLLRLRAWLATLIVLLADAAALAAQARAG